MIKISLARLEKEPINLNGEEPSSLLDIPETEEFKISGPVKYRLRCQALSQGGIVVTGCISTQVQGICGRCLEHVDSTVKKSDLELFFKDIDTDELELTEDVRIEMILALPVNLLCIEECQGLCPHCGINRNLESCKCDTGSTSESSRWDALDNLEL